MSKKHPRGQDSAVNILIGVDKPAAMTSHDVVNKVRSIFGERRVGHSGTLDPLATGAMTMAIGTATRLCPYLSDQDKRYQARFVWGAATDSDDRQGVVISQAIPDALLEDPVWAQATVSAMKGTHQQVPPAYSAIKRLGKKSYEEARQGIRLPLEARSIEIYDASLLAVSTQEGWIWQASDYQAEVFGDFTATPMPVSSDGLVAWDVEFWVSKGTYIRSLARDLGNYFGSGGFVGELRRIQSGSLSVERCVRLEALETLHEAAALDPIALLGLRYGIFDDSEIELIRHGREIRDLDRFYYEGSFRLGNLPMAHEPALGSNPEPLNDGELIAALNGDKLWALLRYDEACKVLRPKVVLAQGVFRGKAV